MRALRIDGQPCKGLRQTVYMFLEVKTCWRSNSAGPHPRLSQGDKVQVGFRSRISSATLLSALRSGGPAGSGTQTVASPYFWRCYPSRTQLGGGRFV